MIFKLRLKTHNSNKNTVYYRQVFSTLVIDEAENYADYPQKFL